jgi:hypothetical protein
MAACALHELHLHLGEPPRGAVDRHDGFDDRQIRWVQLQGLLVGLHSPLGTAAPHEGFSFPGKLLDPEPLDRIDFGLATMPGDLHGWHGGKAASGRG